MKGETDLNRHFYVGPKSELKWAGDDKFATSVTNVLCVTIKENNT